jgi:hypothetical protein
MHQRARAPYRLAIALAVVGLTIAAAGLATGRAEGGVVVGLFFVFLAGGVLNWDRRAGH